MLLKEYFTQQQIEKEFNKIYIEEDDLLLEGEFVKGEGKGIATIENERYHDFEIEFNLIDFPKEETLDNIMDIDWEWYDYLC